MYSGSPHGPYPRSTWIQTETPADSEVFPYAYLITRETIHEPRSVCSFSHIDGPHCFMIIQGNSIPYTAVSTFLCFQYLSDKLLEKFGLP